MNDSQDFNNLNTIKPKEGKVLGIIALVFSILSFFGLIIFVIPAIILAIISIRKERKKIFGIISLVLSTILIIGCTIFGFVMYKYFNSKDGQETLVSISNSLSKELDSTAKNERLSGNDWKASDGSILSLNKDGTYKWWKSSEKDENNYYSGTYKVVVGNDAIKKIKDVNGFNEESFEKQTSYLRNDIHYLVLNDDVSIVDGKNMLKEGATQTIDYMIMFKAGNYNEVDGINVKSGNESHLTKVNK